MPYANRPFMVLVVQVKALNEVILKNYGDVTVDGLSGQPKTLKERAEKEVRRIKVMTSIPHGYHYHDIMALVPY